MLNIHELVHAQFKHVSVRVGLKYHKKYGKRFDPVQIAMGHYEQPQVEIVRFIVERKIRPSHLPPSWRAAQALREMARDGDPKTRDMLSVCHNNHQDYLLEVPAAHRNGEVAKKFLQWLDKEMAKLVSPSPDTP